MSASEAFLIITAQLIFLCVLPKIYAGNTDQNTPMSNDLPSPGRYLEARFIRVLPQEFRANICMRFELYECVGKLMALFCFIFLRFLTLVNDLKKVPAIPITRIFTVLFIKVHQLNFCWVFNNWNQPSWLSFATPHASLTTINFLIRLFLDISPYVTSRNVNVTYILSQSTIATLLLKTLPFTNLLHL